MLISAEVSSHLVVRAVAAMFRAQYLLSGQLLSLESFFAALFSQACYLPSNHRPRQSSESWNICCVVALSALVEK